MDRPNHLPAANLSRHFPQIDGASSRTNGATITHHHHHRFHNTHTQNRANYPTSPAHTDDDEVAASPELEFSKRKEVNCDRRRQDEEKDDTSRMVNMSLSKLAGKTIVTPFLKEHVPEMYAPVSKIESSQMFKPSRPTDPNSKYCYRHQPDSKCRKAADEDKMVMLQSVSCPWLLTGLCRSNLELTLCNLQ